MWTLFGGTLVTYIIAQPCVDINEGNRMLYIQPDECVDCGACEPVCPVEAIYYEDDVPSQWKDFSKVNTEFFVELGSPGGAAKVGLTNSDHPNVVSLPPKE
jgi:ferredoxin